MSKRRVIESQITEALQLAYRALPVQEANSHRWLTNTYRTVIRELLQQVGDPRGKVVLDAGAGRGIVALALRFMGMEVVACERYVFENDTTDMFHSSSAEQILTTWREHGIRPLLGDVLDLQGLCGSERFDAVVSVQVIEHLMAPRRLLDGIHAVLKPGGVLVLTTPNNARLRARLRLLFGLPPVVDLQDFYLKGAEGFVGHWCEYSASDIGWMLRWSGFAEVRSFSFCDALYTWRKHPSLRTAKDALIDLFSKLLPNAQYELLSVSLRVATDQGNRRRERPSTLRSRRQQATE